MSPFPEEHGDQTTNEAKLETKEQKDSKG